MGLFKSNRKARSSAQNDTLHYKKACLHCLWSTGLEHMYVWNDFRSLLYEADDYNREQISSFYLKKELAETGSTCENCGKKGAFDIWDVKLNDVTLYQSPPQTEPQTRFYFQKENGEVSGQYMPIVSAAYGTNLTMFALAKQVIRGIPHSQFIKLDKGFVDIVTYRMENLDCSTNRLRYAGFSQDEIVDLIDSMEREFREEVGIDY